MYTNIIRKNYITEPSPVHAVLEGGPSNWDLRLALTPAIRPVVPAGSLMPVGYTGSGTNLVLEGSAGSNLLQRRITYRGYGEVADFPQQQPIRIVLFIRTTLGSGQVQFIARTWSESRSFTVNTQWQPIHLWGTPQEGYAANQGLTTDDIGFELSFSSGMRFQISDVFVGIASPPPYEYFDGSFGEGYAWLGEPWRSASVQFPISHANAPIESEATGLLLANPISASTATHSDAPLTISATGSGTANPLTTTAGASTPGTPSAQGHLSVLPISAGGGTSVEAFFETVSGEGTTSALTVTGHANTTITDTGTGQGTTSGIEANANATVIPDGSASATGTTPPIIIDTGEEEYRWNLMAEPSMVFPYRSQDPVIPSYWSTNFDYEFVMEDSGVPGYPLQDTTTVFEGRWALSTTTTVTYVHEGTLGDGTEGEPYLLSFFVRALNANATMEVTSLVSNDTSRVTVTGNESWQRVALLFTPNTAEASANGYTANDLAFQIKFTRPILGALPYVRLSGFMVERRAVLGSYFDGSSGRGHRWEGMPWKSRSAKFPYVDADAYLSDAAGHGTANDLESHAHANTSVPSSVVVQGDASPLTAKVSVTAAFPSHTTIQASTDPITATAMTGIGLPTVQGFGSTTSLTAQAAAVTSIDDDLLITAEANPLSATAEVIIPATATLPDGMTELWVEAFALDYATEAKITLDDALALMDADIPAARGTAFVELDGALGSVVVDPISDVGHAFADLSDAARMRVWAGIYLKRFGGVRRTTSGPVFRVVRDSSEHSSA